MQALQRVHRSRSIGLWLSHSALKAPSQPLRRRSRPTCTARLVAPAASAPPSHQQRHVQPVGQQRGGALGGLGLADHQAAPLRAVADGGHRLGRRRLRGGDQRRELRHGLRGVARPAAGLADVDEADRPLLDAGRCLRWRRSARGTGAAPACRRRAAARPWRRWPWPRAGRRRLRAGTARCAAHRCPSALAPGVFASARLRAWRSSGIVRLQSQSRVLMSPRFPGLAVAASRRRTKRRIMVLRLLCYASAPPG